MALPPGAALSSSAKATTSTEGNKPILVKQEHDDDAEIAEMAANMVESFKAKMASTPTVAAGRTIGLIDPGETGVLGFLNKSTKGQLSPSQCSEKKNEKPATDEQSQKGIFGWETLGKTHIPYICRLVNDKYCPVRMLELKLLSKYLNCLHPDIYYQTSSSCITSYNISEAEARLLNEINVIHCEVQFGEETFTTKDLVVRFQDVREFYNFLDFCYNKLTNCDVNAKNKCGFIRINNKSVVPYTVKDGNKYIPLFYFDGKTDDLRLKAEKLEGWDLAYLKFCCKVQGIKNELFLSETCSVINLKDIKSYFSADAVFEDCWVNKVVDSSNLLMSQKGNGHPSVPFTWFKAPSGPVPMQTPTVVVNKVTPLPMPRTGSLPPQQTTVSPQLTTAQPQKSNQQQQHQQQLHNRWPGVVGQSTYQPIVSQTQQNVQMGQISMLHNMNQATNSTRSYQQPRATMLTTPQCYPSMNQATNSTRSYQQPRATMLTTPQCYPSQQHLALGSSQVFVPQPPPLVRLTTPTQTMRSSTYTSSSININPSGDSMHLMGLQDRPGSMLPPHLQYPSHNNHTSQSNTQQQHGNKYPPPLIPINRSTNQRFHHHIAPGVEVIDLSSPPQSPQRLPVMGNETQQPPQEQEPPLSHTDPNSPLRKLIPIMEALPSSGSHCPYKILKAFVNGKLIPCINAKPYIYSELLITLPDLVSYFFPTVAATRCREALYALEIKMYRGNSQQMQVLNENQKCETVNDPVPLIQLHDICQYMTKLNCSLESPQMSSDIAAKRQRTN